jgi:hypothetical protein
MFPSEKSWWYSGDLLPCPCSKPQTNLEIGPNGHWLAGLRLGLAGARQLVRQLVRRTCLRCGGGQVAQASPRGQEGS